MYVCVLNIIYTDLLKVVVLHDFDMWVKWQWRLLLFWGH